VFISGSSACLASSKVANCCIKKWTPKESKTFAKVPASNASDRQQLILSNHRHHIIGGIFATNGYG
jgi:hypothetical protein